MFKRSRWMLLVMLLGSLAGLLMAAVITNRMPQKVGTPQKTYRAATNGSESARWIEDLNKAIREQENKVEKLHKAMVNTLRTKGITYEDSSCQLFGALEEDELKALNNQLNQERQQIESKISSLLIFEKDQLMPYAARLDLPNNTIRKLYSEYLELKRTLESMKTEGLGERHPSVRSKDDEIDKMKWKIQEAVVHLRAALEAQLEPLNARLRSTQGLDMRFDYSDYLDAKREFDTHQAVLQQLKIKLTAEKVSH